MWFILTVVFTVMQSLLQNLSQLQISLNTAPDSVSFCTHSAFLATTAAVPCEQLNTVADVNHDTIGMQFNGNEARMKCLGCGFLNERCPSSRFFICAKAEDKTFFKVPTVVNGVCPKPIQTFNTAQLTLFLERGEKVHSHF